MFGYVKPYYGELKVRENELYNAVYCGLCRTMGKTTYLYSRLSLSYDITFLALVRASLCGQRFTVIPKRCFAHPFKKRPTAEDCEILRYCSAVSAQLSYYSLIDKINDSSGIKKLFYRIIKPTFAAVKKKSEKTVRFNDGLIASYLEELSEIEKSGTGMLDRAADVFGRLLSYFFGFGLEGAAKKSAEKIGINAGRCVYATDACDDLEEDIKHGNYNPLRFGDGDGADKAARAFGAICVWSDTAAGEIVLEGARIAETDIAENILRLGIPDAAKKVTDKRGAKNGKRSV